MKMEARIKVKIRYGREGGSYLPCEREINGIVVICTYRLCIGESVLWICASGVCPGRELKEGEGALC